MDWLNKNWIAAVALACVAVTAAYGVFWQTAAMPRAGESIVYPFTLAYNYTALPMSIVVLLGAVTAFFFWLPTALVRRGPYVRDGVLVALGLAALVASIVLALPLGRTIYRELGQVSANGRTYYLGVRAASDPALNAYTLCVGAGPVVACEELADASARTLDPLPALTLEAGQVRVRVADRLLYEAAP